MLSKLKLRKTRRLPPKKNTGKLNSTQQAYVSTPQTCRIIYHGPLSPPSECDLSSSSLPTASVINNIKNIIYPNGTKTPNATDLNHDADNSWPKWVVISNLSQLIQCGPYIVMTEISFFNLCAISPNALSKWPCCGCLEENQCWSIRWAALLSLNFTHHRLINISSTLFYAIHLDKIEPSISHETNPIVWTHINADHVASHLHLLLDQEYTTTCRVSKIYPISLLSNSFYTNQL